MIRKRYICFSACALIFLGLGLFALFGITPILRGVVLDSVPLAQQNYEIWGETPGKTNTVLLRNFTFYNFDNPRGYLYRGEKPIFREHTNFLYQQRSNFTDYRYSDDKSILYYNFWLYFTILQNSRNVHQHVNVVNLGPIGFWSQLNTVDISSFAIQGFGGLFSEMNSTIKVQAIGQGVQGQFLPIKNTSNTSSAWLSICNKLNFAQGLCRMVWEDPIYGLNDFNNYEIWVNWAYYNSKDAEYVLYNYFGFTRMQLKSFGKIFKSWCKTVDGILNNWYCGGSDCKSYELTLLQLGQGGVTNNPPTGDPVDSICFSGNVTCQGYPQLFAFYKYQFPRIINDSSYRNLKFSRQTLSNLFNPISGTLLNVGNLTHLFQLARIFQQNTTNASVIAEIQLATHAQTDKHAIVILHYAKYFTEQFVLKSKEKGTRKVAGMSGVFSQALYQSFIQFSEWYLKQQLSILAAQRIPNCQQFLLKIVDSISHETAEQICENVTVDDYPSYYSILQACDNQFYYDHVQTKHKLSGYQMQQLCNANQQSILTVLNECHSIIHSSYSCSVNKNHRKCTQFELGVKQWINSTITLNPIFSPIKTYPPSLTGRAWNTELQQWEYRVYLNEAFDDPSYDKQAFSNYSQLVDLLSFDKLFSVPMNQKLQLETNMSEFKRLFYWQDKDLLVGYMRFVTIQVGFGGLTQSRSANQLLFGYEDPFLKNLHDMDPLLGGDPSIQPIILLNEPNDTTPEQAKSTPQSMYTGFSDPMLTRNYITNRNFSYIVNNHTYYDGYKVISEYTNPYLKEKRLYGTDAIQGKPLSTTDDAQYVFIDTLYRVGKLTYKQTIERYGFDAYKYRIADELFQSSKVNPQNIDFHQGIKGFMNLSFLGLPLFASQSHFVTTDADIWNGKIDCYDESGKNKQLPNEYDKSQVVIEPLSGAAFTATLHLQTNVYLQPDELFISPEIMLPVFTIYRSGNMTEETADQLLGDLRTGLGIWWKLLIVSILGIIGMIVVSCACHAKQRRKRKIAESLLESKNQVEAEDEQQQEQKVEKRRKDQQQNVEEQEQIKKQLIQQQQKEPSRAVEAEMEEEEQRKYKPVLLNGESLLSDG